MEFYSTEGTKPFPVVELPTAAYHSAIQQVLEKSTQVQKKQHSHVLKTLGEKSIDVRLRREDFSRMRVINQVDKKFISITGILNQLIT